MSRGLATLLALVPAGAAESAGAGDIVLRDIVLRDVAASAGLAFRHTDGGCGQRSFVEQVGGGAAFFDADGDGRLDLFLASGVPLPGCPARGDAGSRLHLGVTGGRFRDVTATSGLGHVGHATGCAAGDIDADGDDDLFVACFGPDRLYRNERGSFTDIAGASGVADPGLNASAAFLDADRDGDLDLYVTAYVAVEAGKEKPCTRAGHPVYCLPQDYPGVPDRLYSNEGGGRFADITQAAGLFQPRGRGLGVAVGDYDDDGWPDIHVANDTNENYLFHNRGGRFAERGAEAGVAYGENGAMENGMGTDWGDWSGDGRLDLIVTNFERQSNTLYRNLGGGFFEDASYASGTGAAGYPYVGWAAIFADLDSDGHLDILVTNGHVFDNAAVLEEGATYEQPLLVHRNRGDGAFENLELDLARGLELRVGRGAAAGDFDDDGDVDFAVNNLNASPFLLRNDTVPTGRWIGLLLRGKRSNRSAIGARVTLRAGERLQVREVKAGSGYLSHNDVRLHFGLGEAQAVESVTVRWPSGGSEDVTERVRVGAYVAIEER